MPTVLTLTPATSNVLALFPSPGSGGGTFPSATTYPGLGTFPGNYSLTLTPA